MAVCNYCNTEMIEGGTCTVVAYSKYPATLGGKKYPVVKNNAAGNCHDCNVGPGNTHHPGCDMEICSCCGQQLIGCDCDLPHALTETTATL